MVDLCSWLRRSLSSSSLVSSMMGSNTRWELDKQTASTRNQGKWVIRLLFTFIHAEQTYECGITACHLTT